MGINIPPRLTPRKNILVTDPVTFILVSDSAMRVGNTEERENPKPMETTHTIVLLVGQIRIKPKKIMAMLKFPINNFDGANFFAR